MNENFICNWSTSIWCLKHLLLLYIVLPISIWIKLFHFPDSPYFHTDRMTERSVLHLVSKQPLAECCDLWESLWASTTCSISHILSHLRGTYLIRYTTQLLLDTFNCHQTLHSRGASEPAESRAVAMATVTQQISEDGDGYGELFDWSLYCFDQQIHSQHSQQSQTLLLYNWTIRICTFVETGLSYMFSWKHVGKSGWRQTVVVLYDQINFEVIPCACTYKLWNYSVMWISVMERFLIT